jgi:hypothetical protein
MDNPEKLATWGTHNEEKQSTSSAQYVLDTTICKLNSRNESMSELINNQTILSLS